MSWYLTLPSLRPPTTCVRCAAWPLTHIFLTCLELVLGQELLELRKMMAAKERSIDSLRDTLSSTKRSLEARATAAEGALASREQDLARVLAEVRSPLLLVMWVRTPL